ncbi:MAG: dihydroorotate dehydrogenase [Actinomycetia bacterium]|nr:dihydroorotate dehydrogenase [Actinomycetes bacterium]
MSRREAFGRGHPSPSAKRSRRRGSGTGSGVDMSTSVGSVELKAPIMTASGAAGHGAELAAFQDLAQLGAVVVKSLSAEPWAGNPAPRVHETVAGMINSVGLQNPGVAAWREDELPELVATGADVVVSIWGRTIDEYHRAAELVAGAEGVVAVEVNVSCPNLEDRRKMFAHSCDTAAAVIEATEIADLPRWAKLSPNVTDVTEIAAAVHEAGAEVVTLANTVMGLVIDPETRRPVLGAGGGGLSGPGIRPVAVRAVYETRRVCPDLPIIGVGGVAKAEHAVEYLLAGASAVQIGTASFADPAACSDVLAGLDGWCVAHGVGRVADLINGAHVSG